MKWTLYPSTAFAEEIISGNVQVRQQLRKTSVINGGGEGEMNLRPKGEGAKGGFLRAMSRSRKQGYCHMRQKDLSMGALSSAHRNGTLASATIPQGEG